MKGDLLVKLIIQKFGGSSVGKPEDREKVLNIIIETKKAGYLPVAIVSALRYKSCPYSTDALLSLAENLREDITHYPGELDMLVSCGELIASAIIAMELNKLGYPAKAFAGFQAGIITDAKFGQAKIKTIDKTALQFCIDRNIIPVVSGFQGITEEGDITTLGRGGTDTTAVAIGHAFKAERVEFYKEVDGIMTADPYIAPSAVKLDHISYEEIGEMTCCGSKVLEATSVEMAKTLEVPLAVMNTFNPAGTGTIIKERNREEIKFPKSVTAIAHISKVAQVHIELPIELNGKKIEEIFDNLAIKGISLDFIALNPNDLLFIVDMKLLKKAEEILKSLKCKFNVVADCSKVSLVGAGMRGVPGIMIRAFRALRKEGIKVLCSTDSHITIAFLVQGEDEKRAIGALHREFIEKSE